MATDSGGSFQMDVLASTLFTSFTPKTFPRGRLSPVADTPDRPPVLVLGEGITALGVIRILKRAGLRPLATQAGDVTVRESRWFEPVPEVFGRLSTAGLANGLSAIPFERAVLMPCSDAFAGAVAALDPSLASRFPASIAAPDTLSLLTDKGRFADTLMELGIAHPWSAVVNGPADLNDAPDRVFDHAMLKPRDSQSFFRRYRVKAVHVRSRAEAAEELRVMSAEGFAFVLQEYIPGSASQHYFVDGFIDRGGTLRGLFARRRLRMYPLDFGNSTYMVSVSVGEAAQAVESITSLLRRLGYRGIFSAEFKLDPRDQIFRLLEVNARPWWFVEFAARCGVDVCKMAYDDALGRPVSTVDRYQVGRELVFPYMDYRACLEARARGELSMWQWARSWLGSVQPVFMLNDPRPASAELARILSGTLKRRAKALFMSESKATRGEA